MVLIMKKTLTILGIAAGLVFGAATGVNAQNSKVRYADDQMKQMNYRHALEVYQEAYAKKPSYEVAKKTAEASDTLREYDGAFAWWKTVVGYEEATEEDYANMLRAGIQTGNFQKL